jgi:hypothetical protein
VDSHEVRKVHDITSFLLLARICRGLPGSTEGSRHHILSIACRKMTRPPRKYGRFMISHPFFRVREDAAASHKVEKVQYITSFLLRAGRCRGIPGSSEGLKHHILSSACEKMPWPPRKYGRFMISCHLLISSDVTQVAKSAPWPRVLPGLRPPRSGMGLTYISQCLLRLRNINEHRPLRGGRRPGSTLGRRPGCGLCNYENLGTTQGAIYHVLSFACMKIP